MKGSGYLVLLPAILIALASGCSVDPVSICTENPHYFFYKGKPLVMITSDHHYGAIVDKDFDYVKYIGFLSDQGMNLTRIYPGGMFEPADKWIIGNPLGPKPGRQLLPWIRSDQSGADPSLAEPGNPSYKFDLDKWDEEYFIRLRDFVATAEKKNIIVEVAFFNGMYADCWPLMAMYHKNNVQGVGNYEPEDCGLYTTVDARNSDVIKYQKEYVKKITSELNSFSNVIYDICDEPTLQMLPDKSIRTLPDSLVAPWLIEMQKSFAEAEAPLPEKHILGQTIQSYSPDLSDEVWCKWLPAEYVKLAQDALTINYADNKPIVIVESNYYGLSLTRNPYTADAVRVEGWWFMLAGGAGDINLNGEYYRGNETGSTDTKTLIAPQKKILKDFIYSLDFVKMSAFTDYKTTATGVITRAIAEKGNQYAIYIFHGSYENEWGAHFMTESGSYRDTLILNSIPSGGYIVEWIDPSTGKIKSSEKVNSADENVNLITPAYSVDIALRMLKNK